ncbi:MAG: MvaI/BcnI family restriction endonuclease [Pseudomonadota bacterium]|nr:MvaI/BcnI family restriction endonuclease [Pseudomonadota bacterium]
MGHTFVSDRSPSGIGELTDKLTELRRRGYVSSLRKGNTGIGCTLESLLGITENNLKLPDLGIVELKSQRNMATNRVTMFTFNRGVWKLKQRELIETYGYIDTEGRPSLYCTVSAHPNNQGLFIRVDRSRVRLYQLDKTLIAEWHGEHLISAFKKKMLALVMVYADTRTNSNGKEEFWFNEAYLLTQPDTSNLLELIRAGSIVVDIRMHLKESGVVRNHGTGFRIDQKFMKLCFGKRKRLA